MSKFQEIYNLPRLNHEDLKNLNGPIDGKKIKTTIKNIPKIKSSGPNLVVNSTKENLIPVLLKLF